MTFRNRHTGTEFRVTKIEGSLYTGRLFGKAGDYLGMMTATRWELDTNWQKI